MLGVAVGREVRGPNVSWATRGQGFRLLDLPSKEQVPEGLGGVAVHRLAANRFVSRRWSNMNSEIDPDEVDVATLLEEIANGHDGAAEQLMPLVYDRLRFLAKKLLGHESPAHTLQRTALVNEAYLRMVGQRQVDWQGKTHFFAIGAKMMRRILVDHARRKLSQKRGGGLHRIELADDLCVSNRNNEDNA